MPDLTVLFAILLLGLSIFCLCTAIAMYWLKVQMDRMAQEVELNPEFPAEMRVPLN